VATQTTKWCLESATISHFAVSISDDSSPAAVLAVVDGKQTKSNLAAYSDLT
jgi:hypothetical protein